LQETLIRIKIARRRQASDAALLENFCLENSDDGRCYDGDGFCLFRAVDRLLLRLRPALRGTAMIFDYSLAGVVTAGLLLYLIYALLKPELF
jgi:K+-transporting ATPase KdpF subunit